MKNRTNLTCPQCKASLSNDSEFCHKCGTKLSNFITQDSLQPKDKVHNLAHKESRKKNRRAGDIWEEYIWEEPVQDENYGTILATQTQGDLKLALQQRVSVKEAADKKKAIAQTVVVLVIVVAIVVCIILSVQKSAYNGELRNFATEEMRDEYTNVYADLISMEPEYFVYTTYNNVKISEEITDIICKCTTIEGKTVWVVFKTWEYPGGSSRSEAKNKAYYYSKTEPLRVLGQVRPARQVVDKLENTIGSVYVLDVNEIQSN